MQTIIGKGSAAVKPALERVLDAAEELFATRGFEATSLGDIAEQAGLRGAAIYKYFKNKQHLYEQVLARLLDPALARMREREAQVAAGAAIEQDYIEQLLQYNLANPNSARLIQHASLVGGEQLDFIVERWLQPITTSAINCWAAAPSKAPRDNTNAIAAYIVCSNLLLAFVTLGPLYAKVFGAETLTSQSVQAQARLMQRIVSID